MKKFVLLGATVLGGLLAVEQVQAGILEIRGGVGMTAANPNEFEDDVKAASNQSLSADSFQNYNADVFINIPAIPIGVGLRQEWLNQDQSGNGASWDLEAKNTSLLVDWRIIDTGVYVGPIVGAGYPSGDLDFNDGAGSISKQIKKDQMSYFLGAEAGLHLGSFILAAEAGYQSLKLKQDDSAFKTEIDLSGFYGKAMVGISFL